MELVLAGKVRYCDTSVPLVTEFGKMPSNFLGILCVLMALFFPARAQGDEIPPPQKADLGPHFASLGLAPKVQGDRNTCSLFAITAAAEFEYGQANPGAHTQFSEEFLIWAANAATGLIGDQAMFYEAVHGLNALGICSAALMPYEKAESAERKPTPAAIADAASRSECWKITWIKRWNLTRPLTDEEMKNIKIALVNGHPVACGLRWPMKMKGPDLLDVPPGANIFDGHSILLVGYAEDSTKPGGGVFSFRNSYGPSFGKGGYGSMSFAYARAYANDALWLQFCAPKSEVPAVRYEAESLIITVKKNCEVSTRKMNPNGGRMWSGGAHLLCKAAEDSSIEFSYAVVRSGRYRLRILATAAPDFGSIRFAVDGKSIDRDFDLYSGRICPSGSLELGEYEFAEGKHTLRVTVSGKNPGSSNFNFALDTIDLIAIK